MASRIGSDYRRERERAKAFRNSFYFYFCLDALLLYFAFLHRNAKVAKYGSAIFCFVENSCIAYNVYWWLKLLVLVISLPRHFCLALTALSSRHVCEFLAIHHRIGLILSFQHIVAFRQNYDQLKAHQLILMFFLFFAAIFHVYIHKRDYFSKSWHA